MTWSKNEAGSKIFREFTFDDFSGALNFVNKVAALAEAANHHPDIHVSYNKVRLELSTHTIGGLSDKDFALAAEIDKVAAIVAPAGP